MAATEKNKPLALDTNILFDLSGEKDFAHTFREVFQANGYRLMVPPTVIQELAFQACQSASEEQLLALHALRTMRDWQLVPFDLRAVGHGITEQFSNKLIEKRLLPEGEFNDGLIVAETALANIPVLVTSDRDLLDIEPTMLISQLDEADLPHLSIFHPKSLLKVFSSKKR